MKKTYYISRLHDFWIGLTDTSEEGSFVWSDGTILNSTWNQWLPNNPLDNDSPPQDCVFVQVGRQQHRWNDVHCEQNRYPFVCQTNKMAYKIVNNAGMLNTKKFIN